MPPQTERLQKYLARAGVASRRAAEKLIEAGQVKVNGQTVTVLGVKIDPQQDQVTVNDRPVRVSTQELTYIMLYKPRYVLSSTIPEQGRKTVFDFVDVETRLFPVGRLDFESEGLILLTNDGELTQKLTHPSFGHEREYEVLVHRTPSSAVLRRWRAGGFEVDGKAVGPMEVEPLPIKGPNAFRVILREGRKRQIREIAQQLDHPVISLVRVRLGPLKLGNLKPGHWRHLTTREVMALKRSVQTSKQSKHHTKR